MDSSVKKANCEKQKQCTADAAVYQTQTVHFPDEILEMIFSNLTHYCDDMVNISRACPKFYQIVHPSAHLWLMEKVFQFIFRHLDLTDILNCRLVCKLWRKGTTLFLKNHPPCFYDADYHPPTISPLAFHNLPTLMIKGLYCMQYEKTKHIKKFQKQMKNHFDGNPFLVDLITFTNDDELFHYYWDHVYELLSNFGDHITRIHLYLDSDHRPKPLAKYKVLREALLRLPNLKHLKISGLLSFSKKPRGSGNDPEADFNKLKKYVEKYPLPPLPNLESLVFDDDKKFDMLTYPFLLTNLEKCYGSQVVRLCKNIRTFAFSEVNSFPELFDLQIEDCSRGTTLSDAIDKLSAPNLQKLGISGFHLDGKQALSSLFHSLKNGDFGQLRYLSFMYYINHKLRRDEAYPILESVQTLELVECNGNSHELPMDQLVGALPNLEYIFMGSHMTFAEMLDNQTTKEVREDSLQIFEWAAREQIYQCRVWKVLPKLKEISFGLFGEMEEAMSTEVVEVKTFTREKYNSFVNPPDGK